MNLLLDTHTFFWAATGSPELSWRSRGLIGDERNEVFVSSASAWEVATKVRIGKWPEAVVFEKRFSEAIRLSGFSVLEISVEHALLAGRFTSAHKDPFHRMLAAQARVLAMPILSRDRLLDTFGIHRIW